MKSKYNSKCLWFFPSMRQTLLWLSVEWGWMGYSCPAFILLHPHYHLQHKQAGKSCSSSFWGWACSPLWLIPKSLKSWSKTIELLPSPHPGNITCRTCRNFSRAPCNRLLGCPVLLFNSYPIFPIFHVISYLPSRLKWQCPCSAPFYVSLCIQYKWFRWLWWFTVRMTDHIEQKVHKNKKQKLLINFYINSVHTCRRHMQSQQYYKMQQSWSSSLPNGITISLSQIGTGHESLSSSDKESAYSSSSQKIPRFSATTVTNTTNSNHQRKFSSQMTQCRLGGTGPCPALQHQCRAETRTQVS